MKSHTTFRAHSANLMAIIALIFFCFLFFHQGKKRKSGRGGEAPAKAPTNLLRQSNASHEGQNNSLRLSGQLEGDHRLDLLLLPFLLSREEKEVGARGLSPCERPNEPPTPTRRTPRRSKQLPTPIQTNPMKVQTIFRAHPDDLMAIIALILLPFIFTHR